MEHQYLTEFKKLEARLKSIPNLGDGVRFNDILDKAAQVHPFINEEKNLISDLYGLRNVFAHADRSKYIAEVNDLAFKSLARILDLLKNPPKAIDFVRNILGQKNVFWVKSSTELKKVINVMAGKIYTHVPIYQEKRCTGVFTETSLLLWLKNNIQRSGVAQFHKKYMDDINPNYINPDTSANRCIFKKSSSSIFDIWQEFREYIKKGERLGAIILTKDGKRASKPDGIITSWDLPKIHDYLK